MVGGRIWRVVGATAALAALATCAPRPAPPPTWPHPERLGWADRVDWSAASEEAAQRLSTYLQLDTSNPPGHEEVAARQLAEWLAAEGIASEVLPFAPGRANLVARLEGRTEAPPLCLLSHLDVATAEAARWQRPPFGGEIDEAGVIWGRGALDMKSVGVIELLSLIWLRRLGVPLERDVILLAVGDEEVGNAGVKHLAAHHWDRLRCGHVLNEGGLGVRGALFDDLTTLAVSFTEKGALWLRLWADGETGHGSTPMDDSAPQRLLTALERLRARKVEPRYHPELHTLLRAIGEKVGGVEGAVLRSPALTRGLATGRLMDHPLSRAILTDTINLTGFGGAEEPNVVPGAVWAQLDVRLLPGTTAEAMLAEIRSLIGDEPYYRIEVLEQLEAVESPTDDPVYEAIVRNLRHAFPDAAVGPLIMMGTTDSQVLRPLGVHAYGVAPFVFDQEELRGMHGDDERISKQNLGRGLEVLFRIVLDVAAASPPPNGETL